MRKSCENVETKEGRGKRHRAIMSGGNRTGHMCCVKLMRHECSKAFIEVCKTKREGHITETCLPGIPLLAYESFISVPMCKSSCRPLPVAVMSLAS